MIPGHCLTGVDHHCRDVFLSRFLSLDLSLFVEFEIVAGCANRGDATAVADHPIAPLIPLFHSFSLSPSLCCGSRGWGENPPVVFFWLQKERGP